MDLSQTCAVCLDSMRNRARPVCQLGCGHWFHDACVCEHARRSANGCPLCRVDIALPGHVARLVPRREEEEEDPTSVLVPWMRVASDAETLQQLNVNTIPKVAAYTSAMCALAEARGEPFGNGDVSFLIRIVGLDITDIDVSTARFWAAITSVLARRLMSRANAGDENLTWIATERVVGAGTEELCAIAGSVVGVAEMMISRNEPFMRTLAESFATVLSDGDDGSPMFTS